MPVYEYIALNKSGRKIKGSINADSERSARSRLRDQGVFPSQIEEATKAVERRRDVKDILGGGRVPLRELAAFTRQFATLIGAGLPLVEALSALTEVTANPRLKQSCVTVRERVLEGSPLNTTLAGFPKIFDRLYVNLVAAGEASGSLDHALTSLADYLESQLELRRKLVSAFTYPALMLSLSSLVVLGLFVFVIPRVVDIFAKQNATLPFATQVTLAISHFLISYWWLLFLLIAISLVLFRSWYRSDSGRRLFDSFFLRAPLIHVTYGKVISARVASTLSTLLSSGVELLRAIEISRNVIGNVVVRDALDGIRDRVREGKSLSNEMLKSGVFPSLLCRMVSVGERSGELEAMLGKAASSYEKDVASTLEGLTNIIEPLLLIIVGAIVLLIVISVLLPMVSMIDVLGVA
jgi:general secretion pathway protein F